MLCFQGTHLRSSFGSCFLSSFLPRQFLREHANMKAVLLVLSSLLGVHGVDVSASCRDAGFGAGLSCQSCDQLGGFGLAALEDGCRRCCSSDTDAVKPAAKAAGAILEVCK
eukprot:m.37258 g.37258  ORF g.37258 m.37258 type:complete len:111 (-) comp11091_c0_seq1:739-1071(-)